MTLDTVGVAGMADPFTPATAQDRMTGRGACDMKGGVAGLVVAAEELVRRGTPGRIVLVLANPDAQAVPELPGIAAVGSFVDILSVLENPDGTFNVLTHGQERCRVEPAPSETVAAPDGTLSQLLFTEEVPYPLGRGDPNSERLAAWDALETFRDYARTFFPDEVQAQLEEALPDDLLFQASFICANLRLPADERQELLEAPSLVDRFGAAQRRMREQLANGGPSGGPRAELPS